MQYSDTWNVLYLTLRKQAAPFLLRRRSIWGQNEQSKTKITICLLIKLGNFVVWWTPHGEIPRLHSLGVFIPRLHSLDVFIPRLHSLDVFIPRLHSLDVFIPHLHSRKRLPLHFAKPRCCNGRASVTKMLLNFSINIAAFARPCHRKCSKCFKF